MQNNTTRTPQQLKNQWLMKGTDENNKKTMDTPQQIKNLGMMMKMNLGMMMKTKQSALMMKTKQSALKRMTMKTKNKQRMKTTLGHNKQKKDAVAAQRKEGGSLYKRNLCIYGWFSLKSIKVSSKLINISHKQILNWKKQVEKMKGKSNQHAKSLGDGVTSFLSLYTDRLLSFIFEMRETGMAVSVNSIVLKASQLSREFREKSITARHSAIHQFINVHGFVHQMGHTYPNVNLLRWNRLPLISYV